MRLHSLLAAPALYASALCALAGPAAAAPELGELEAELLTADTPAGDDNFGRALAAGDFDGDGFPDLAIGAYGDDSAADGAGAIHLWSGGPSGPTWTGRIFAPEPGLREAFGYTAASAGDVNGDGFMDLIVGAPQQEEYGQRAGAGVLFYGSEAGLGNPQVLANPLGVAGDNLGLAVAGVGDLNGDGFADLAMGARRDDAGSNAGAVYFSFGGPSAAGELAGVIASDTSAQDDFGSAIAGAGDVDGDGLDEVLVGAWGQDGAEYNAGAAYLFYGSEDALLGEELKLTASDATLADGYGLAVAGRGDVNGDGYPELAIGAPERSAGRGAVFLYFGGAQGPDGEQILRATSFQERDGFGVSVDLNGDVDADGFADLLVGASGDDDAATGAGAGWLFMGSAEGPATEGVQLLAPDARASMALGAPALHAGDLDGDGDGELLLGAVGDDTAGTNTGAALLLYGACAARSTFYADTDGDGFGDPDAPTEACGAPLGHVDDASDCDDADPLAFPDAEEVPGDGVDQDCDGADASADDTGVGPGGDKDCGCAGSPSHGGPWALLLSLVALRRRARRPAAQPVPPRP